MHSIASRWPGELLLPMLVAAVEAAAIAPLIHLLATGTLSIDPERAPWPVALALLGLGAFWSARILAGWGVALQRARVVTLVLWATVTAIWFGAQYGAVLGDLARPGVARTALLFAAALALVAWWRGLGYGSNPEPFPPDRLRRTVRAVWLILTATLAISAVADGRGAADALASGRTAVPVAVACGLVAVAAGQIEQARRTAIRRDGRPPDRGTWLAFAGLAAVAITVGALLAGGLVGRDAWESLYEPIVTGLRWLSLAVVYVLIAIAFVFFLVIYPLVWLARFAIGGGKTPDQPSPLPAPAEFSELTDRAEQSLPTELALALRAGLIVLASLAAALFLLSALRRYRASRPEADADERRESIWSRDLARGQLRRLLTRPRTVRRATIPVDLAIEPTSVRDAYRYLAVLAERAGFGRQPAETALDFSTRVTQAWPDLAEPVTDLTSRYLRARYGEQQDDSDRARARRDWAVIWRRRQAGHERERHRHSER